MTLVLRKMEHIPCTATNIMLDWLTGDIHIEPSDSDHIVLTQLADRKFPKKKLFQFQQAGKEMLSIVDGRKSFVNIGFNLRKTILKIQLPGRQFHSISIRHVGGQVTAQQLHTKKLHCSTTSGQARLSGYMEELILHATGSHVTGHELEIGKLELRAISSKIKLAGQFSSLNLIATGSNVAIPSSTAPAQINSISTGASVTVTLPENDGFTLQFQKRSGRLHSDFPLIQKEDTCTYINSVRTYHAEVRGGSFTLRKS